MEKTRNFENNDSTIEEIIIKYLIFGLIAVTIFSIFRITFNIFKFNL